MRKIYISFITVAVFSANAFALTYTVTTLADAGAGSLRDHITTANGTAANDIINFTGISGTIILATALPAINGASGGTLLIDGSTATGYVANTNLTGGFSAATNLAVTIDGGGLLALTVGMTISSDNNIIKGLNFINVGTTGTADVMIEITSGADNNQILGCYIGTDVNGTVSSGANTEYGIRITGGANNQIGDGTAAGRNLISGLRSTTTTYGISISGASATGNTIKGNMIGLQKDGATYLVTTQRWGVYITSSAASNTVGGTGAGDGNVISGNNQYGIFFESTVVAGNSVLGNIIGLQANGTSMVASTSQSIGIFIFSSVNNTIGGSSAGARNIISANTLYGVYISQAGATGNLVKGNYIGLDITGTTFIAGSTQSYGVNIGSSAASNTIGGTAAGEGNVISGGSGYGIYFSSAAVAGNTVIGNIIGPQANGTSNVTSNAQTYGVYIGDSPNNTIGGTAAAARNIISANTSRGIWITGATATGNLVRGNYIGLDQNGTTFIAGSAQSYGVYIISSAANNTIGGTGANEGNVISGNVSMGISISAAAAGNIVLGNIIGPQANGTSNVASNAQTYGIAINASPNNIIGGNSAAARNIISANLTYGVYITGASSTGNVVKGNYIGLDQNGTIFITSSSQDYGVFINLSAASNTIGGAVAGEGNVISGNVTRGITSATAAAGNSVLGNIIGPQADGTSNVASNAQNVGIQIDASPNNTIGGTAALAKNIISANLTYGVYITGAGSTGNLVKGNYIGLDQNGTTFITSSSQDYGVYVLPASGGNNIIGGTGAGEGNLISGNVSEGIHLGSTSVAGNSALGNIIGPQANGTSFVASNAQTFGVNINSSPNNTIGGTAALAKNIISANETYGIWISNASSTGNSVKGNYIGPSSALANIASSNQDYGVYIVSSAANNTIGGSVAGEANTIAFNTVLGVSVTGAATDFNKISRNPIYTNGGKPINLSYGGGSNNGKPIPVITTANTTTVVGTSGAGDIVEVFMNSTGNCNDAVTFVGAATANGSGNWSLALALATTDYVFATATDGSNNTSEFNPCVVSLPVEMLYFTAVLTLDKKVLCQWATASEINNDYFIVQRTRDGINYDFIAKVNSSAPNGNSSTTLYYSALDPDPYQGTSYYRLKQVDFNGDSYYSQLVPINLKSIDIINIYPNPSFGNINYLIGSVDADEITITVLDALGRKIMEEHEMIDVGITKKQIDISSHAAGSYLLQITTKTMEKTQKQFVIK